MVKVPGSTQIISRLTLEFKINLMNETSIVDVDLHDLAGNTTKIIAHLNGVVTIMERFICIGNGKLPTSRPGNRFSILEPLIG